MKQRPSPSTPASGVQDDGGFFAPGNSPAIPPATPSATHNLSGATGESPKRFLQAIVTLALVALCLCVYLLTLSLHGDSPLGCGGSTGCGQALNSSWARWFHLPVSAPAAAVYLTIAIAGYFSINSFRPGLARYRPRSRQVLLAGAIMAGGAAIGFIAVEILNFSFCRYCLAIHACGLTILALTLWVLTRPAERRMVPFKTPIIFSAMLLGCLAAGELLFRAPTFKVEVTSANSTPVEPANVHDRQPAWFLVSGGRFNLDPSRVPVVGNASARHFIVVLNDYACPHCRNTHHVLDELLTTYGGQIALVVLPTSLDRACNPFLADNHPPEPQDCALNRIALNVWCADATQFPEMDHWLFSGDRARTEVEAEAYAIKLVGAEKLNMAKADPRAAAILRQDAEIFFRCKGGVLPKLLFGATTISGEVNDVASLAPAISREWNLSR